MRLIEPFIYMINLSFHIYTPTMQQLMFYNLCTRELFSEKMKRCLQDSQLNNRLQKEVSKWSLYMSLMQFVPLCISPLMIGYFSSRYSPEKLLFFPCISIFLFVLLAALYAYIPEIRIQYVTIASFIPALLGGLNSFRVLTTDYITQITSNPGKRSTRFLVSESLILLGTFTASMISGYLITYLDYTITLMVCMLIVTLSLLYSALLDAPPKSIFVRQPHKNSLPIASTSIVESLTNFTFKKIPPEEMDKANFPDKNAAATILNEKEPTLHIKKPSLSVASFEVEEAKKLKKKRNVFRRLMNNQSTMAFVKNLKEITKECSSYWTILCLMFVSQFLIPLAEFGTNKILVLYTLRDIFNFMPTEIGYLLGINSMVRAFGGLAIIPLLLNYCKVNDYLCCFISVPLHMGYYIMMGLAKSKNNLYVAPLFLILHNVYNPIFLSVVSRIFSPNVRNWVYSILIILGGSGVGLGGIICNYVYMATVDKNPALVFAVFGVFSFVGSILGSVSVYMARNSMIVGVGGGVKPVKQKVNGDAAEQENADKETKKGVVEEEILLPVNEH